MFEQVMICLPEFRETFLLETPYLTVHDWFDSLRAENKQPTIPTDEANDILKNYLIQSYEGAIKL